MEFPLLDDHNKTVEKDVAAGRPDGQIMRAGVLCSVCFARDETEVELHSIIRFQGFVQTTPSPPWGIM